MERKDSWPACKNNRCEKTDPHANGLNPHRIPNLQFDLAIINRNHTSTELHANGKVVNGLESLVCELEQQT
jgi:hypothetical protein